MRGPHVRHAHRMGLEIRDERKAPTRARWRVGFDVPGLDHAHTVGRIHAMAGEGVVREAFDGARVPGRRSDLDKRRRVRGG